MIKPYRAIEDEQDPYKGYSDSNAVSPDQPPVPQQQQSESRQREAAPEAPKPYMPPPSADKNNAVSGGADEPQPQRTFAQMEAEGQARPPMPRSAEMVSSLIATPAPPSSPMPESPAIADETGFASSEGANAAPTMAGPSAVARGATTDDNPTGENRSEEGFLGMKQQGRIRLYDSGDHGYVDQYGNPVDADGVALPVKMATNGAHYTGPDFYQPDPSQPNYQPNRALPWAPPTAQPTGTPATPPTPVDETKQPPQSNDAVLKLLTDNATGANPSDLQKAVTAKTKAQLESSSPYDSKAVRDEYNWLSGNIDDKYAMDTRALDEGMAARGLYGSAGKDFHSGRLSDLNVGKRSAKTSLAQDLANKYATTKGQYDANAINQGESVASQGDAQQRAWQQLLQSFGNDAFNHDLAGAEFGQRQNESEQDFLMRMLQLGYGV